MERSEAKFDLPGLDHELEKLWISLKEEEHKEVQFRKSIGTASMLNSLAIILLCISVLILFSIVRKEVLHEDG